MNHFRQFLRTFWGHFQFFRAHAGKQVYLLVALVLLMSYAEGLGIALFLPLFLPQSGIPSDAVTRSILRVFHFLGFPPTTAGALIAVVIVFAFRGLLQYLSGAYQYALSTKLTGDIRQRIVKAASDLDYRYMLQTNTGTLTNLITTEVSRTTSAFVHFSRVLPPLFNVLVFSVIITALAWKLTVVVMLAGIFVFYLLRIPTILSARYSVETTRENARLSSFLIQMLQSFKYLLATASFGRLQPTVIKSVRTLARMEYKIGALYSLSVAAAQPLMALVLAGVMYYQAVVMGRSLAPLFVLLMYLYRIMSEIFLLQSQWQIFVSFVGGIDATAAAVRDFEVHREVRGHEPYLGLRESIALEKVGFAYDKVPIFRDLSLRIQRHSTVAVVGESGSGKSTLVDLIVGLVKPNSGAVTIDGRRLETLDLESFRRRVAYVSQDTVVFDDTVANNISLWAVDSSDPKEMARIQAAARNAGCEEFILAMPNGFQSVIGERGVKVSGGQRQRLAIARELFKEPEILILDEATSALDSESEHFIQQSIDSLRGRMTIVVIAHRLSTIRNCDYVYVLQNGQVAEEGSFTQLLATDSRFRRMCEMQKVS